MGVRFSHDVEKERLKSRPAWGLYEGFSLVQAVRTARDLGWKEKKVQVRWEETGEGEKYYVEPYEEGCGCKGILKYKDFFN